ncbi:ankyrin repeat domain-containing protein [Legionella massiliensis]|nr:ankyrin repeat domain-containing protein [Legionella massiliensis]
MQNDISYAENTPITSDDLFATYLGNSPLMWGVANSSVSFTLRLLDLPDLEQVNFKSTDQHRQNSPLILSVSKGWNHFPTSGNEKLAQRAIATKLLERGAEVNAVDAYGRTALHYACLHRNLDAIRTLIQNGASLDIGDSNGQTPLDFCCLDFPTALNRLEIMTGGPRDYTFTLERENFDSSGTFYQSLSNLLSQEEIIVDAGLFKSSYDLNQKINNVLIPIYNHAKDLYVHYVSPKLVLNDDVIRRMLSADIVNHELVISNDSLENRKINALFKVYLDLKIAAATHIDFSNNQVIFNNKKLEIEQILTDALDNPDLRTERDLLTKAGMALLNLVSICCLGIPLIANYCFTGQFFFSHQTKSEKLLNIAKEEMMVPVF